MTWHIDFVVTMHMHEDADERERLDDEAALGPRRLGKLDAGDFRYGYRGSADDGHDPKLPVIGDVALGEFVTGNGRGENNPGFDEICRPELAIIDFDAGLAVLAQPSKPRIDTHFSKVRLRLRIEGASEASRECLGRVRPLPFRLSYGSQSARQVIEKLAVRRSCMPLFAGNAIAVPIELGTIAGLASVHAAVAGGPRGRAVREPGD